MFNCKNRITFIVAIDDDETTHTEIHCGGKNFVQTREGLKLAIKELQRQLDEQHKCPMHVTE